MINIIFIWCYNIVILSLVSINGLQRHEHSTKSMEINRRVFFRFCYCWVMCDSSEAFLLLVSICSWHDAHQCVFFVALALFSCSCLQNTNSNVFSGEWRIDQCNGTMPMSLILFAHLNGWTGEHFRFVRPTSSHWIRCIQCYNQPQFTNAFPSN